VPNLPIRGDHFRFGSVFIKKSNQTEFFFEKKTETRSNRPVSVRFGFLRQKPVQTGLAQFSRFWLGFFRFWLGFFQFGSVFSVWLGFSGLARFFFRLVSVQFGFFSFLFIKPKPNRTGRFFQKINRFFFRFGFFGYFFSGFLGLIDFPVFLLTPTTDGLSIWVHCDELNSG